MTTDEDCNPIFTQALSIGPDDQWCAFGGACGMNNEVTSLAIDISGHLYAGGSFTTAGGIAANNIAKWDGTTWSALGTGLNNAVLSLAIDSSGNLYAGGGFTTAGGKISLTIAEWKQDICLIASTSQPIQVTDL